MSELILGRSTASSRTMGFAARAHAKAGELVTYPGNGHLITFAPTGTGKTSGPVITNALKHPGQLIVLDMKGEVHAATADARRKMGQKICAIDLRDSGAQGSLNPLHIAMLSGTEPAVIGRSLAAEFIERGADERDRFWGDWAETMIAAGIAWLTADCPPEDWPSKTTKIFQNQWYAIFNTGTAFVPAKQPSISGVGHAILPTTPGVVWRFKITQNGDRVSTTWIDTHSQKEGAVFFTGRFVSATTIEGEGQAGDYTPQNHHMRQGTLTLDGQNRLLGSLGGVSDRGQGPPSAPVRSVTTSSIAQRNLAIASALLPMFLKGMFPGSRIEYSTDPCANDPTDFCFSNHPYPRYDKPR